MDDMFGVVLGVEVTTGEANEDDHIPPKADAVAGVTGTAVKVVTVDLGYASGTLMAG